MSKTKKQVMGLATLLLVTVFSIALMKPIKTNYNSTAEPNQLLRFHIIANSNSSVDQAIKLKVRDVLLKKLDPIFQKETSVKQAEAMVKSHQKQIAAWVQAVLRKYHVSYKAKISLGQYVFPTKTYGTFALPAGRYEALEVKLGQARGQNWWCVLYPPLCLVDPTSATSVNEPVPNPKAHSPHQMVVALGNAPLPHRAAAKPLKVKFYSVVLWHRMQRILRHMF